jgi:hypothetical protein
MRVLVLQSIDGAEWDQLVVPPLLLPDSEAIALAQETIAKAKAEAGEEWDFADLEPALQAAGFMVCQKIMGPDWDGELRETV